MQSSRGSLKFYECTLCKETDLSGKYVYEFNKNVCFLLILHGYYTLSISNISED